MNYSLNLLPGENQGQTQSGSELTLQRSLSDIVAEYDAKKAALPAVIAEFEAAGNALKSAATVSGVWGRTTINTGSIYESTLAESLLKSAWYHVYEGLKIGTLASAQDKKRFEQAMAKPAPFTLDNILTVTDFGGWLPAC